MRALRFFAIVLVYGCVSAAWMALGVTVWARTEMLDDRLSGEMKSLWGPKVLAQASPYWAPTETSGRGDAGAVAPSSSKIAADIKHNHRYKGLLWYSTFTVDFDAEYTVPAAGATERAEGFFVFSLPADVNGYDNLTVEVNDKPREISQNEIVSGKLAVPMSLASENKVHVRYTTNGQDVWLYSPGEAPHVDSRGGRYRVPDGSGKLAKLSNFSLRVTTDFGDIDYPKGEGGRSPNLPAQVNDGGRTAEWQFDEALTGQVMGIVMPERQNAGPLAARMSFFAPVSLFFFLTVLFTVVILKKVPLHPMHYLFISAGFFAFHILMAYLADIVSIHAAFWICAAVSVLLVVSYMRLVAGVKFAVTYVAAAQLVYLVGFSYAFFWEGQTGLTVVVVAILTLFVLMQATGRVNWSEVFKRRSAEPPLPPAGSQPPQA